MYPVSAEDGTTEKYSWRTWLQLVVAATAAIIIYKIIGVDRLFTTTTVTTYCRSRGLQKCPALVDYFRFQFSKWWQDWLMHQQQRSQPRTVRSLSSLHFAKNDANMVYRSIYCSLIMVYRIGDDSRWYIHSIYMHEILISVDIFIAHQSRGRWATLTEINCISPSSTRIQSLVYTLCLRWGSLMDNEENMMRNISVTQWL